MPKLYSSRDILSILTKQGFTLVSQKGSHKKFRRADKTVIVPDPSGLRREDFE